MRAVCLVSLLLAGIVAVPAMPATAFAAEATAPALPASVTAEIDRVVRALLVRHGQPGASVAVVSDGRIAYVQAYGAAGLDPKQSAKPSMRFAIGSVSKQFTAAAMLMLAEDGKLSLADPVGKYLPGLTDGDRVTIRQVLDHTAGYPDYYPQDYVFRAMQRPTTPQAILQRWGREKLEFQPGDDWRYSNTGYVIAGRIIEQVTGQKLFDVLQQRIFMPLHMTSVTDYDNVPLTAADAAGTERYAMGPLHPATREGAGWLFSTGGLAMRAEDLARWDVSMIEQNLLRPDSYKAQRQPTVLTGGKDTGYGLGIGSKTVDGRKMLSHGGAVGGFLTENRIYPDDKVAIVVLTNGFGGATGPIADGIAALLLPGADKAGMARELFAQMRAGKLDRSRFSDNANGYFSDQAVREISASLQPAGEVITVRQTNKGMRGAMTQEVYLVTCAKQRFNVVLRALPDGKIEQFGISAQN